MLTGKQFVSWAASRREFLDESEDTGDYLWTERGILMGLPTTWFMLNLVHLFWIDETAREMSKISEDLGK